MNFNGLFNIFGLLIGAFTRKLLKDISVFPNIISFCSDFIINLADSYILSGRGERIIFHEAD
jgi:hypothetical protein